MLSGSRTTTHANVYSQLNQDQIKQLQQLPGTGIFKLEI